MQARRTSSVSLPPPPPSPLSVLNTAVEANSPRDVPSPAQTLWTAPSPTQTLGFSSPELPPLPSYGILGNGPRTPSTVARQDRDASSYYTASWGSPYRNPPPTFDLNRSIQTSTQFGSDDFEEDSSNLQFGLEHLLPPTLVEADSPNRFSLEHLIPRLENNASPTQFNLEHLIPSRLLTTFETPTRPQHDSAVTPRATEFNLLNPSEALVRQFLEGRWNSETNDWLSDSTLESDSESKATVEPSPKKTHRPRRNNRTLNQQDFWSHFSEGQKEKLGKMMASRYAPSTSDAHSRQGSGGSMRSALGRSVHAEKPPVSPKEAPLPESPNPAVETPSKSYLAPPAPHTATPRVRKKVMVKGKGCVISIPRDIPRGTPGYPPKPMTPRAVEEKLQQLESEGYDTKGFGAWNSADGSSGMALPQNRGIWPNESYIKTDRATGLRVRLPCKADWDAYVNHMLEAKLAALGVGIPEEESTPSPMSRQASTVHHPGQLFSPPLPTPSAGSHRGRQGSIVSGSFPLGPSPGHMSRQSIASPGAFGGMNIRPNMHMHRHSTFSPASFMQQTASPTGGAFSPAGYFGVQGPRGQSPALSLSRPDLSGAVTPGSPFGMRPNQQYSLTPTHKDDLLAQMQQQQQQLQAQLLQQQQQQVMSIRPSSTLAEVPEDEDEEGEVPMMKNANATRPDIAVPSPRRGHRHNISTNLEREARDAEYHLEEAIDKQFNEGGDFSTEPETEQLKPSNPVTDPKWESSRPILHQPQPHSRAHSLAKPQQQPMSFAFGAQSENPQGDSDGTKSQISDITNPSLEDGEIREEATENSSARHSKAPSQVSNSWKDSKIAFGKPAGSAMHSKHTSRSSVSKLNVEAKEFKFNPSASFSPGSSFSGFPSFTSALKSPVGGAVSDRTSVDGLSSFNVSAPAFKPDAPVFKPDAPVFVFKPAVEAPAFKPAALALKPAIEAHAFRPAAQTPEFKPSGTDGSMPSSGFSFNAPSFKPDAPTASNPTKADFTPTVEPPKSIWSSIFGRVDISESDIVKPAKRSKAIPIVRPDATRQKTPEKEDEDVEKEDAEGRPMQAEGREKRARRGRDEGDDVPRFALHPVLPSQPIVIVKQSSSPLQGLQIEKEATPEEKENLSPGGSRAASKSKSPEPLPPARAPTAEAEESTDAQTSIDDLSVHESDATPTVEEKLKFSRHKSSLSATAKPFEFRPNVETAGYDFGIHVTKPSIAQTEDEATPSAVPRHLSRSPATTFRPSDDGSYMTALESRRHVPYPESESVDFDHLGEPSFNDIDAVMKHMNDEGSDFGVERDETSWEHSSPRRTHLDLDRHDFPPNANLRSDAPSPSPRRLRAPRNIHASPTSTQQDPFDDERAGLAYESPVHRLNNADDVPMSDWDEGLVSDGQDKIQTRSRFFDTHVDEIIGRLLQNRLDPLEKNLQGIQDAIAMMSQRRGRRSMSTTERLDSDADDEDDEWGTDSHYRNRSPGKNRKLEKIRSIVKEALESHQPPVTSLPIPEPVQPEKIRDMVVEALAALQPQAPVEQLQAENVRELIMEALSHQQPQWTPPKFDHVPADEIRAIVENAIVAHKPAPVEPAVEPIKPDDIRSFVMEAFETHAPPPMPAPVPEQLWSNDIKAIITEALAQKEPAVEPLQPEDIRFIVESALATHQPLTPAVESLQPETIRSIIAEALTAHEPVVPAVSAVEPVQPDLIRSIVAEALASHQPLPAPTLAPALEAPVDIPQPQIDMSEIYQVIGSLKASIAQTTSHHLHAEDVRELIDDAFKRQSMETAKREETQAIGAVDMRVADLEAMLQETTLRFNAETVARKEVEAREANSARLLEVTEKELMLLREQTGDDENKIRALQEECEVSRRSIDSFHAGDEEVRIKLTALFAENEELKLKAATFEAAEADVKRKLDAITAENEALTYTLEEHRLSAHKWRTDLQHAHEETDKLRLSIDQSRLQTDEATRVRESMRAKFEKLQQDMVVAAGQAAAERAQWQKSDEAHMKKYEVLSARIEAEGRTRERLERELERLEGQERDFMKLRVALEQTQKHNRRLEEMVEETRQEGMEHKRAADKYEREFRDAREAAHVEIRRMRVLMEGDIDKANNEVNIVRHELENEIARVRAELDHVRMDADTAKEKHELDLEAAADAKKAAIDGISEGKRFALQEQHQVMERRLDIITKEHLRVLDIAREDKERAETFHKERLSLADSKMDHLHDKVALLEEKLSVAKEAASAAAAAAQNVKTPTGPASYASGTFDKISPQALRESISVLQEQLQEREQRIESLNHQLDDIDTDAPAKLRERDTEIGWLRELLGVRIDDLNDLINALAQPAFDRENVRDAAIRIRTNLQMEQSEKERLMSGDQKAFPTLATLSNFASPKAVQLAAAFGNWRSKGRENASSALTGGSSTTMTPHKQTPSRSSGSGASAQSFLSGLMTPPTSNLRRTPDLPSSGLRPTALLRSNSSSSRGSSSVQGFPSLGKQTIGRVPSTPPLMRKSSYDNDAAEERFGESGFYDDDLSTVDGEGEGDMTPIGLNFGHELRQ